MHVCVSFYVTNYPKHVHLKQQPFRISQFLGVKSPDTAYLSPLQGSHEVLVGAEDEKDTLVVRIWFLVAVIQRAPVYYQLEAGGCPQQ